MKDEKYSSIPLCHHGVKGMKWGVRRYQNKDGSLTKAGRQRIKEIYSKENQLSFDKRYARSEVNSISKAGVIKGNNGVDIIRKGSVLGRLSDTNKESFDRRKYAYVTKVDERAYKDLMKAGHLGTKNIDSIYSYKMEALSDLKVASGEEVAKQFINKYGDKRLKDLYKEYVALDLRNNPNKTFGLENKDPNNRDANYVKEKLGDYKNDTWAGEYAKKVKRNVYNGVNKLLYKDEKINSDVCRYYEKKGYDAIVDIEDYLGGNEYPLIILNPQQSVKVTSIRKLPKRGE